MSNQQQSNVIMSGSRKRRPTRPFSPSGHNERSSCPKQRDIGSLPSSLATPSSEECEENVKMTPRNNKKRSLPISENSTLIKSLPLPKNPTTESVPANCKITKEEDNIRTNRAAEINVSEENQKLFDKMKDLVKKKIERVEQKTVALNKKGRISKAEEKSEKSQVIRLGCFEMEACCKSDYPKEYADLCKLYICEFCLKYMETENIWRTHMANCKWRHPPGKEVYRDGTVSVFEVDGGSERIYSQNLCLLAKLFLDCKVIWFDVESLVFYVLTSNDEYGCHIVGYFSKEKRDKGHCNLSCIVALPAYQKKGYGRFLIDFSYLLSRELNKTGTPERPFSDLGRVSYASYWRTSLFEWIHKNISKSAPSKVSIEDIAKGTGISPDDIVELFGALNWLNQTSKKEVSLELNWTMIEEHMKKLKSDKNRIFINEQALKDFTRIWETEEEKKDAVKEEDEERENKSEESLKKDKKRASLGRKRNAAQKKS